MHPPPLEIPPAERPLHSLVMPRRDVQWGRPVFRAPTLATWPHPPQLPAAPVFPVKSFGIIGKPG